MSLRLLPVALLLGCGDLGLHDVDAGTERGPDAAVEPPEAKGDALTAPSDAGADAPPTCPVEPATFAPTPHVVPIYLAAADLPCAETAEDAADYARLLVGVRGFVADAMGSTYEHETFTMDPLRVMRSRYTLAEWDDFGRNGFRDPDGVRSPDCPMYYAAMYELVDRGLLKAASLPRLFTSNVVYLVLGGGGTDGSCAAGAPTGGLAANERLMLQIARARCPSGRLDGEARFCTAPGTPYCASYPWDTNPCAPIGAIAHELLHGFTLPHGSARMGVDRDACLDQTILDRWWLYDMPGEATLCDPDRRELDASAYFAP